MTTEKNQARMKKPKKNKNLINISFTIDKLKAERFKQACKELKITQKSVIEKAIDKTIRKDINKSTEYMIKDIRQNKQIKPIEITRETKEQLEKWGVNTANYKLID